MQIKRFEAADMTEALRLVKRQFGDDAVILSAKEVRSSGFFSALRKRSVEITAATDYPHKDPADRSGFSKELSKQLDAESQSDRVSLSSTQAARRHLRQKRFFPYPNPASESVCRSDDENGPDRGAIVEKRNREPDVKGSIDLTGSSVNAWIMRMAEDDRVAEPFYRGGGKRSVIALVGPSGAGKSTTVAKLARHCLMIEKQSVGLISLDRFRMGANAILRRAAGIMDLPLTVVHDINGLQSALEGLTDADTVLIDTPGMSGTDQAMMDDVGECLRSAEPDETHLVANATVRKAVLAAMVDIFSPLGVNRLLYTHVDELVASAADFEALEQMRLGSSFYADGVDLFDCLQETVRARPMAVAREAQPAVERVTWLPRNRVRTESAPVCVKESDDSDHYVANRSSELFHQPDCRSVKRINADNIVAFDSVEQAMEDGFKPCRACCDFSMLNSPVRRNVGYPRSRAI